MTIKTNLLIFLILFSIYGFAQKNTQPTEEDINIAKSFKKKYPDDAIVIRESEDIYSFKLNKRDQKVTVDQKSTETLMNINPRVDIQKYSFYNGQISINVFDIKKRNNKSTKQYIKDKAYNSNDLFHNDTRVKFTNINFPFLGYTFKTSINKTYHDIKYFTKINFNSEYPTVKKTIKIEVPNWLDIEFKEINFKNTNIEKSVTNNLKNNSKVYHFTIKHISAIYRETNEPGPGYIYPHILILAKSYSFNNKKINLFNSTQDLYNWYKSLVNSLENDNVTIKNTVKALTKNTQTDEEKIKNIYYWVQDNIRYIAFEDGIAGFKPDEASNVFTKRYGDCKGMANLTKQMLTEAGFDARLTWIGTKRIPYDYSTPNLSVDNHMICTLLKDGEVIFLDGTEKFNAYGEYANRIQGKQVLIENGDTFILKTVPESNSAFNKEVFNYNLILNNDILEGTGAKKFDGESRASLLYNFDNLKNDKKDEFLEYYLNNGNSNIKVSNIETSNLNNRETTLNINYNIKIKNAVSSFDNKIYIDIDFDKELENFLLKNRKTDYIFNFKRNLESTTKLEVPSSYIISQIPSNINISSKNYNLNVTFTKNNNIITYKKSFELKNAKIETSDFDEWNTFISKLKSIYNDQIVITNQ